MDDGGSSVVFSTLHDMLVYLELAGMCVLRNELISVSLPAKCQRRKAIHVRR